MLNWFWTFLFDFIHVILTRTIESLFIFVILYFPISHAIYDELISTSTFQKGYFICAFCYDHSFHCKIWFCRLIVIRCMAFCVDLCWSVRGTRSMVFVLRIAEWKHKWKQKIATNRKMKTKWVYLLSKYYVLYNTINIFFRRKTFSLWFYIFH